jgi:hypothetical protein
LSNIRDQLVAITLSWEEKYGVAPQITSAISEYDAAMLVGCSEEEYSISRQNQTAVTRGVDFVHNGMRFQVKANRPSGRPGSFVTKVAKANNYEWVYLIWILYNKEYEIREAWLWDVEGYKKYFEKQDRISPEDMKKGKKLR